MTDTPAKEGVTVERSCLTHHEQMIDAQRGCVPCKLCGGQAIITDAGPGSGYYIRCSGSKFWHSSKGCLVDDRRLSGWAYNVMDWWNELQRFTAPALTREKRTNIATLCAFEAGEEHGRLTALSNAGVAEGWKLVPVDMTEAMATAYEEAGWGTGDNGLAAHLQPAYAAMLSASPKPPAQVGAAAIDVETIEAAFRDGWSECQCRSSDFLTDADQEDAWSTSKTFSIAATLTTSQAVRVKAATLLAALDEAMPHIDAAITMAFVHGQPHAGPSLEEPIQALRDALDGDL